MADADEDEIPRPGLSGEETDLTEETQDFRFLSTISRVTLKAHVEQYLTFPQT